MEGEWFTYAPDGREVLVRRQGELWLVRCGQSEAHNKNLDVALTHAIRADVDIVGHAQMAGYADWIRTAADTIDRPGIDASSSMRRARCRSVSPATVLDGLMRAMVSRWLALTGPIFGTETSRSNTSALAR